MRALFFLLDGESNASSRQRVLQYVPILREHGIEARISRPVPEPLYQRLVEQRRRPTDKALFYALFLASRARDVLAESTKADVVVIQRDLFPFGPPWLERLLARRNPHLVYDTDDATYLRPGFTPKTPFQHLRRFDKVIEVVRRSRWVSVATEPIATWARQYNPNVSVVPMAVDLREYDQARQNQNRNPNQVVVGWAGTAGSLGYLEKLAPVLREVARRHDIVVRVISGGYSCVRLPGLQLDARPWRADSALSDLASFDIGLVPLDDSPFEQAKFPFKLLQYLALGVPSVSARVGTAASVIRHADNGCLAATHDEWRDALETLITDAGKRQNISEAGRATVAQSYTLERVAPLLIEGLNSAAR